jgi:hypothetical protein
MATQHALVSNRASAHDATPSVLARYDNLEELRQAIRSLESHGVDGDDLALVGEGALDVEADAGRKSTDRRLLASTSARIAVAVVLGAIVGAVIGAIFVGSDVLIFSGLIARGWVFALVGAWFAACGALVGAFLAFFRALGFSDAMPLTYATEPDRPLWLAVYGHDEDVEETVAATHPVELVTSPSTTTVHPDEGEEHDAAARAS